MDRISIQFFCPVKQLSLNLSYERRARTLIITPRPNTVDAIPATNKAPYTPKEYEYIKMVYA